MKNRKVKINNRHRKRVVYLERSLLVLICCIFVLVLSVKVTVLSSGGKNDSRKPKQQVTLKENQIAKVSMLPSGTKPVKTTEEKVLPKRKIDPNKPMVALTFDDGPGGRTMELLETLEEYNARATFFICGYNLSRTDINVKKILTKMNEVGCDVSNHTMNHMQLDKISPKKIKYEVESVNKIIKDYTGQNPKELRPPYGAGIHEKKVIKNVGLPMIYWSIDTLDWKNKSKKQTVKNVMKNVKDGDIVLMHDIHGWSVDATKVIIPKLIDRGYQLVTISEMAEARGIELRAGETYFNFYK